MKTPILPNKKKIFFNGSDFDEQIPIEDIITTSSQHTIRANVHDTVEGKEVYEKLRNSIEEVGMNYAAHVFIDINGHYVGLAGHNRMKACKELGCSHIPVKIIEKFNGFSLDNNTDMLAITRYINDDNLRQETIQYDQYRTTLEMIRLGDKLDSALKSVTLSKNDYYHFHRLEHGYTKKDGVKVPPRLDLLEECRIGNKSKGKIPPVSTQAKSQLQDAVQAHRDKKYNIKRSSALERIFNNFDVGLIRKTPEYLDNLLNADYGDGLYLNMMPVEKQSDGAITHRIASNLFCKIFNESTQARLEGLEARYDTSSAPYDFQIIDKNKNDRIVNYVEVKTTSETSWTAQTPLKGYMFLVSVKDGQIYAEICFIPSNTPDQTYWTNNKGRASLASKSVAENKNYRKSLCGKIVLNETNKTQYNIIRE